MNHNIQSSKMGKVAEFPLKLDLQWFADEPDIEELGNPDPDEPENVEWEQFDSDKPKEDSEKTEQPEVVEPEPELVKQDHETNKAFQELRKAKDAAERQIKEADEWAKNTYGHMGISSFKEYQQAVIDQQKREEYQEKGIDYDEVRKIAKDEAENHPDVVKARQIEQKYAINAEIRSLKSAFPDVEVAEIDDLGDLVGMLSKLPNWDSIQQKINKGYELKDAFELANRDDIAKRRVAAAEQEARNKLKSKDHLKPSGSAVADDSISVPQETLAQYRTIFKKELKSGKMTEADFINHYKKENSRR